ncbi:MAG: RNA polymerase sigma factor [Patescibacteria group bacterium]|jgi:RNA polymerase sigma-70 factor (ECF subfamily)
MYDDLEILMAVKDGDAPAYRLIVEKYHVQVYSLMFGMLRNREDARDITQNSFVEAYTNLDSFSLESKFHLWLYGIAMKLAVEFLGKRKKKRSSDAEEVGLQMADRDNDVSLGAQERRRLHRKVLDALDKLPIDQKKVILLRELEGLSYREISDVLGIPRRKVKRCLFSARMKLRKMVHEYQ